MFSLVKTESVKLPILDSQKLLRMMSIARRLLVNTFLHFVLFHLQLFFPDKLTMQKAIKQTYLLTPLQAFMKVYV